MNTPTWQVILAAVGAAALTALFSSFIRIWEFHREDRHRFLEDRRHAYVTLLGQIRTYRHHREMLAELTAAKDRVEGRAQDLMGRAPKRLRTRAAQKGLEAVTAGVWKDTESLADEVRRLDVSREQSLSQLDETMALIDILGSKQVRKALDALSRSMHAWDEDVSAFHQARQGFIAAARAELGIKNR